MRKGEWRKRKEIGKPWQMIFSNSCVTAFFFSHFFIKKHTLFFRLFQWAPPAPRPPPGHYRLEFDVGEYFERTAREVLGYGGGGVARGGGGGGAFYPSAAVEFVISPPPPPPGSAGDSGVASRPEHLHIPLTFSPFGYSTYRGS